MKGLNDIISVIIPVYNVEDYLPRCLESVINNTYKDLQIICINDGSTDNSLEILNKYAYKDKRIIVIDQKNSGVSSARNVGLSYADGQYIAFVDSDDWIHDRFFEFLHKAITINDSDLAVCSFIRATSEHTSFGTPMFKTSDMTISQFTNRYDAKSYVWNKLFKYSVVVEERFSERKALEDTAFIMDVIIHNPELKIVNLEMHLYAYYSRENSLTDLINAEMILEFAEYCAKKLKEDDVYYRHYISEEAIKNALSARFAYVALNDQKNKSRANKVIRTSFIALEKNKLRYLILYLFPSVYRWYRIKNDPTMLDYEKHLKREKM